MLHSVDITITPYEGQEGKCLACQFFPDHHLEIHLEILYRMICFGNSLSYDMFCWSLGTDDLGGQPKEGPWWICYVSMLKKKQGGF